MDIKIELTRNPKEKPSAENLGFGQFSDHMFLMEYTEGKGWHDRESSPMVP